MAYGFRNVSFNKAFLIFVFVLGLNLSSSCASGGAGDPSDEKHRRSWRRYTGRLRRWRAAELQRSTSTKFFTLRVRDVIKLGSKVTLQSASKHTSMNVDELYSCDDNVAGTYHLLHVADSLVSVSAKYKGFTTSFRARSWGIPKDTEGKTTFSSFCRFIIVDCHCFQLRFVRER